jgi:hypothetical protein
MTTEKSPPLSIGGVRAIRGDIGTRVRALLVGLVPAAALS